MCGCVTDLLDRRALVDFPFPPPKGRPSGSQNKGPEPNPKPAPSKGPADSGDAPPATTKKGLVQQMKTGKHIGLIPAPVEFVTLQKDRSVTYVAKLFKLDPLQYLTAAQPMKKASGQALGSLLK